MKLYIDTNVIIDAIQDRNNLNGKNLGTAAAKIFFDALTCKHYLIISTWMLEELYRFVNVDDTRALFQMIRNNIITIQHTDEDIKRAKESENYDDMLHLILAEKADADCIVTNNIKHFREFDTTIKIRKPEYLF